MRIRTACPERRDPRNPRDLAAHPVALDHRALPGCKLLLNHERAARKFDMRVENFGMQRRHQHTVLHLQQDLRQACDPSRALTMADVRLHRTDRAELPLLRVLRKCLCQSADLDRVTQ